MIDILKTVPPSPEQWEIVIEGMRNSHDSWDKSDSIFDTVRIGTAVRTVQHFTLGENDYSLAERLAKSGASHSKYRRMLPVIVTINAPLYWWKEFDTYKVGTVENSCSTMHTIHKREFTLSDFSYEKLLGNGNLCGGDCVPLVVLMDIIRALNWHRKLFLETENKEYWWQMIQMLPSSYNQKRTISLNYEVLSNMYFQRKDHKLDEWRDFCEWIRGLPYSELIVCAPGGDDDEL